MRAPVTTRSSATVPKQAPTRSKPCGEGWPRISSGSCASSPPGISTPAVLGAGLEALADRAQRRPGRPPRRRCSRGPPAARRPTQITSLTFIAMQSMPDRVVAPELLGDDHLGADAVGRQRDAGAARRARSRSRSGPSRARRGDSRPGSIVPQHLDEARDRAARRGRCRRRRGRRRSSLMRRHSTARPGRRAPGARRSATPPSAIAVQRERRVRPGAVHRAREAARRRSSTRRPRPPRPRTARPATAGGPRRTSRTPSRAGGAEDDRQRAA